MRNQELFERIQQGKVSDVTFDEFSALVKERGFRFDRFSEDYWVFEHSNGRASTRRFPKRAIPSSRLF